MSEENKAVVRRFHEGLVNRRDLSVADELVAPTYVYHAPGLPMEIRGPEGIKNLLSVYTAGFPDVSVEVHELVAENDKVAARLSYSGTHRGDFQGIPPTGRQFSITSISLCRLSGGKIVEEWEIPDNMRMLQQLGIIPTNS